ncbi:pre-toxin TG domain-containing protein [Parageobacillus thermoglucosidasius]|uniref:pre-toxin TG domain-containing protein n=1 Tax=Parageobacillus thermoglucosidasius TaxID=1426 RepID=UPI003B673CA4
MTTIRVKPEELETVAKHVPDAEDACRRARTSLSWELPSLVMEIPGIGSAAIQELTDELLHWLRRYEEKLNEAEELLYRTAAAIRQADQTLADNMKEFGLELLGWYDLQRLFGEYDPVTGERLSFGDRLFAGGMLLLTIIPLAKGAGVAGKAAVKGAKAAGIAAEVSKWISKTKNVLNVDKIKRALQTIYHQVIKGPITETIRSFKHQWENFLENVGSVLQGPQPALVGIGPAPRMWMSGAEKEVKETTMNMIGKTGDEVVGKGAGNLLSEYKSFEDLAKNLTPQDLINILERQGWKKEIQPSGKKSGPATIFTDSTTGIKIRIHATPGQGRPYFRVQNKDGNYLDKNGKFPSNATRQELRDLTHFYFGK